MTPSDASEEICKLTGIHMRLDVLQMTFEEMEFEDVFDGIWACGVWVHIPKTRCRRYWDTSMISKTGLFEILKT